MQGTLRDEWGYTGHVVSDCGAVGNQFFPQHTASSLAEASAKSINAGTDLNCGNAYSSGLADAVASGAVSAGTLDAAVGRALLGRFELGEFDPVTTNAYKRIPIEAVGSAKHLALAQQAARDSIVLLKNLNSVLPLMQHREEQSDGTTGTSNGSRSGSAVARSIAVVGPQANDSLVLLGNYHGDPAFVRTTPLFFFKKKDETREK